ncbi:hypothetical protein [Streptomyces sp. XH2]|uniref:hypothetical protein n=1 Tax=Streptomyces sp. XH2 TaxID=3412483 RepID=UPI003C7BD41C
MTLKLAVAGSGGLADACRGQALVAKPVKSTSSFGSYGPGWIPSSCVEHSPNLLELSHHSLVRYRLPTTGELVPLLQIVPSKTDIERLLLVSPELADVLSAIIRRVRDTTGAVSLVRSHDRGECEWQEPAPLLFPRRICGKNRAFTDETVRTVPDQALIETGLTDATDEPLRYTPHDFPRLFITDAIFNGLPPHIAQVIAGHQDIKVTLGYKAVYPEGGDPGAHGLPGPPPVPPPQRGIPCPHRRGMAGVPRPLRAAKGLHRCMRPRVRHPLASMSMPASAVRCSARSCSA